MPRKFDRCVMEVKRRGGARNAYAVCNAALRRRNPSSEWIHKRTGAHVRVEDSPHYPDIVKVTYLKTGRSTMMRRSSIEKNFRPARSANPRYRRSSASVLSRGEHLYSLIAKRPGGKRLVYTGEKFTQGGRPQFFKTVAAVKTAAKFLRLKYPILKPYSFYVKSE